MEMRIESKYKSISQFRLGISSTAVKLSFMASRLIMTFRVEPWPKAQSCIFKYLI